MAKATKAKVEDYRSLDTEALAAKIQDEEVRLKKLHFSHSVNPIENPLTIRHLRRSLAQMKTEQRKRVLGVSNK
jgi:large subunit ribosomal protein L29